MRLTLVTVLWTTASAFGGIHSSRPTFGHQQRGLRPLAAAATTTTDVVSAANLQLLSERGRAIVEKLIEYDTERHQQHLFENWPEAGDQDAGKQQLTEQLADLDDSYPGGLITYLSKAATLLKESADNVNPFDEYTAVVPEGVVLTTTDTTADEAASLLLQQAEQTGLTASAHVVFCLVAGGLGERLGYSGIKLALETNLCDEASYLEHYCTYILALQQRSTSTAAVTIPLVIMTSGDTDAATRQLLHDNNYFGMNPDQVTIVTQDKVPALKNGHAALAMEDRWTVLTKPHGHGDIHHLLCPLFETWLEQNKTHVIFLQDTNALVVNSILPTLGVSLEQQFHMNSICIPRLAGEAAGAIARLEHKTDPDKSLVINVEYNQLDPLLQTQGDGDVADPQTGYSPFPGNANNIVMEMKAYARTLRGADQGVVDEFVNPKYKDNSRTEFKKPTRLECMMQDIPKLFQKEMKQDAAIGFTMFDRWYTFSPAKNALIAGLDAVKAGSVAPGTMSSAESDMYIQNQRKLQSVGVDLPVTNDEEDKVMVAGIPVTPGPRIILSPSFALVTEDLATKVVGPMKITQRSSLVLRGQNIHIHHLDLDGALVIQTGPDTHVTVNGLSVTNQGWELQELDPAKEYPETVQIRGYTMAKHETAEYILDEPGHFVLDASGVIRKVD